MKVCVTGGTGFIGSHTAVVLLEAGHDVVIVDNLFNSHASVVDKIEKICGLRPEFVEADVSDDSQMKSFFDKYEFDALIHFAGYKAVGESVHIPLKYYLNNLNGTMILAKYALEKGIRQFIFSSSATVYGDNAVPYREDMNLMPSTNPYGETKAMSERILSDIAKVNPGFNVALLRYFNPVGAHKSGLLGEVPRGVPNNLMPYITQVAKGKLEKLMVFGNDYDTPDGTGVRDYIHVVDLAYGHLAALENMPDGLNIYNLGSGTGNSVLELIHTFETVNQIKIPYRIAERRAGDIATSYADVSKAERELKWKTQLSLEDMVKDSWNFEKGLDE